MDRNIRPINCADLYLPITFMCRLPALLSARDKGCLHYSKTLVQGLHFPLPCLIWKLKSLANIYNATQHGKIFQIFKY